MTRNGKKNSTRIPRVYDKNSGEYKPVLGQRQSPQNQRREKYSTPQRRAEARRRRRRHSLIIFYLFVFVTVIVSAAALSLTVLFKIDTVMVEGKSCYSSEQIVSLSGIKKGQNLFLTDTGAAQKKIMESFPYIGTVKVSRHLPAKITISVTQEPASGVVLYGKKYAVLGASGKVLELVDKIPQNLTLIKGLSLSGAEIGKKIEYKDSSQTATYESLTKAISAEKLDKVTSIDLSKSYQLIVVYDNRINLELGSASDLEKKLRIGKGILDSGKIKNTEKGNLDLSTSADDEHAYFDPNYADSSG